MRQPILSIFVSSTWEDLQPERAAVFEAIGELGSSMPIESIGMERFGSQPENTLQTSLGETAGCQIYVGIIGGRYGSGITEEEYNKALELRMPCFIYFKKVDEQPAGRARLIAFKKRLLERHTCARFAGPTELKATLKKDLRKWYKKYSRENEISPSGSAPYALPPAPSDFVGRDPQIKTLLRSLKPARRTRIVGIDGMSGVGKTALALEVAESLRDDYPDERLFIKLGDAKKEPFALHITLLNCITQLGGKIDTLSNLESLAGTYRQLLSGRRVLIVLDDAVDEAHVEPFKPPPGCALLITSQEKLALPDTGITRFHLDQFEESEAVDLLTRIAPRLDSDTARQIARLYGNLPLALRPAGSLLAVTADLDPADYVRQARRERTRLKAIGETGVEVSVQASFTISYDRLDEEAKRVFRQLVVFPASFDAAAEEKVCEDASSGHLSNLVRRSLVSFDGKRYHLHNLMRVYAKQRPSNERAAAAARHTEHFLSVAQDIGRLYGEKSDEVREGAGKLDAEWENLQAARAWMEKRLATDEAKRLCIAYADALKYPLYLRRPPREQAKWLEVALAASRRHKLRSDEGRYLCDLCTTYSRTDSQDAVKFGQRALRVARKIGERAAEANALGSLGNVYAVMGQARKAGKYYEQCLPLLYEEGDALGVVHTLNNLGFIHSGLGKSHDAIEFYRQAFAVARKTANPRAEAMALINLSDECIGLGEAAPVFKYYERALRLLEDVGDDRSKSYALTGLGNAHAALKQHGLALGFHQQALNISHNLGDESGVGMALGNLGNALAELLETDRAVEQHKKALKIGRKLGERVSEVRCLMNLGHAYYLSGDSDRAINFHRRALKLSREVDNPVYEARARWNIAQAHDKQGRARAAEKHAETAQKIFNKLRHPLVREVEEFLQRRV